MTSPTKQMRAPAGAGQLGGAAASWEIWTGLAAAALALAYLITSIQIAAHRLLWFDEIGTVLIARLPGTSRIMEALSKWDNNMPALYFLVVHWFFRLFGEGPVAARLPSTLAMTAGLLITFNCTRRLTDGLHGLIAMGVLACSCLPYYGYEARSYSIYFMLAACCFWIWVHGKGRSVAPLLFGAATLLAIMVHYYAVLGLVPYAAWEALVWKRWRMPSAKLIAGVWAVCAAVAVLLPQMSGAKRYSAFFWSPPTFFKFRTSFEDLFPEALFLLVLILIWVVLAGRTSENSVRAPMQSAEAIGWLGLLTPFAGYVVARLVTNAYVSRYFLGILPGVAVAFSCWIWRHYPKSRLVPAGVFLILAGFGLEKQLSTVRHPESIDPFGQQTATRQALGIESALRADGKRFTLLTNGMLYQELWYYAKHPEQYVLLIPSARYLEVHNTTRYTLGLARYYPMQFWSVEDLRKHARETALLEPTQDDRGILQQAGLELRLRSAAPLEVDYLQ